MINKKENNDLATSLIKQADKAFESIERRNAESTWKELAEFILPSQFAKFQGHKTKGAIQDQRVFDNTAIMACRDLSSALHSTITNPAAKWCRLRFQEAELNNLPEGNAWCSHATNTIHSMLTNSNFDTQVGTCYQSYAGLGTMIMLHDEVYENGLFKGMNFNAWHLGEVAYAENSRGLVDYICRKFCMTNKQCIEKFGKENLPDEVIEKAEKDPLGEQQIYHCIYPRPIDKIHIDPTTGEAAPHERPFASYYIMIKGKQIVKEDGYYEFPVYVGRWLTLPGEIYGYGPGHIARANVLTLNVLVRLLLQGMAKAVNPAIFQEQNNLMSGDIRPGKIVTVRNINGLKEATTQARFDIGFLEAKDLRDSIKSAFYIDKLMLPPRTETGEMTAYEIDARLQQTQIILGPPMSRLDSDFLNLLVMRSLKIGLRSGEIHPIPESVRAASRNVLSGNRRKIELDVSYVNALARSQQMSEIRNITSWVQEVAGMAQFNKPEALDRINADEIAEHIARIRDIPEELVLTDEAVQQIRAGREQQMQAQMALQAGESMGNIVKNVSTAKDKGIQ